MGRIDQRGKNVVLPPTINPEERCRATFNSESQSIEEVPAFGVVRHVIRHDPMHLHSAEYMLNRDLQRLLHDSLPLPRFSQRIPQVAGLKRPTDNIRKRTHAYDQIFILWHDSQTQADVIVIFRSCVREL